MNSVLASLMWRCACGCANRSQIWRLVDGRTDPELLDVGLPGLLSVTCPSCSARRPVDEPVVLIRSTELAPVIVFLPWEQLDDVEALADLQTEFQAEVPAPPMVVPRELLPVILTLDTDRDARPKTKSSDHATQIEPRLAAMYQDFLRHALTHREQVNTEQLLWSMLAIPPDELAEWLQAHPEASHPRVLNLVQQLVERATSAGDEIARGSLLAARAMLIALASGTPSKDAIQDFGRALTAHNQQVIVPRLEDLWNAAASPDRDVAIRALRELEDLSRDIREPELRRQASAELAARLLGPGRNSDDMDEAIALLEEVRDVSTVRDDLWATATNNLAAALGQRRTRDTADDLRRAVALLREAVAATDVDVKTMAASETNLGLALSESVEYGHLDDANEAIVWIARGLSRRSPQLGLEDWAYSKLI